MKLLTYVALVMAALLALAGCGGPAQEEVSRDVLAEGLDAANAAGRPLLIDVYADW